MTTPSDVANSAQRPGCQGACSADSADQGDAQRPRPRPRRRPARAASRPARAGPDQPVGRQDPVSTAARCRGWSPQRGVHARRARRLPVGRVDRRARRGRGRARRRRTPSPISTEREVVVAAAAVAGDRAEQAGQQRGPQVRARSRPAGWRSGSAGAARSSAGTPSLSSSLDRDEREAEHLDEAGGDQRRGHRPAGPLGRGQPAADRGPGHDRVDGVVADQPADLLDVVVRVGQVGPPARRR